ncbi:MAG: hypothetical protein ACRDS9_12545, partial [Pseudonocardiaceae bacterium]
MRTHIRRTLGTTWSRVLHAAPPRDERGSTALFYVVIVFALFATIGLVVDGGGKIRALQQADS